MPTDHPLFQETWQDFLREAVQDQDIRQRLESLLSQREGLIDAVVAKAAARGLPLSKKEASSELMATILSMTQSQTAAVEADAPDVTEDGVTNWLKSGLPYSTLVAGQSAGAQL